MLMYICYVRINFRNRTNNLHKYFKSWSRCQTYFHFSATISLKWSSRWTVHHKSYLNIWCHPCKNFTSRCFWMHVSSNSSTFLILKKISQYSTSTRDSGEWAEYLLKVPEIQSTIMLMLCLLCESDRRTPVLSSPSQMTVRSYAIIVHICVGGTNTIICTTDQ